MSNEIFNTFGSALKFYRERNGWSREKAADKCGVVLTAYGRFEANAKGHVTPTKKVVEKYAEGLGAPVDELMVAAGYLPGSAYTDAALDGNSNWRYLKMSDAGRLRIKEFIAMNYRHEEEMGLLRAEEE